MKEYPIQVSGNAPWLYPTDILFGLFWLNDDRALEMPKKCPFYGEWGKALSTICTLQDEFPIPSKMDICWISLTEEKHYTLETPLPKETIEQLWKRVDDNNDYLYTHLVAGMAPYGHIALWLYGIKKSVSLLWLKGDNLRFGYRMGTLDLHQYCNRLMSSIQNVRENLEKNGLPPRDLFDNYMKQFTYRYQVVFEKWDDENGEWKKYEEDEKDKMPEFDYIEEALYDGTHDKLHDGGLMKYHEAGKPKKLAVQWHVKKLEWSAYFWFEDERIRAIYDRFYGTHRNTNTDFMLRIDPYNNKYELSLYRYGLSEPMIISEKAYQLLVFKNKFECYRSTNYNQHSGAWIW